MRPTIVLGQICPFDLKYWVIASKLKVDTGIFFLISQIFLRRVQLGTSMIFVTFDRFMKSKMLTTN